MRIDEITADNFIVPTGEEHLYHVKQEQKSFDQNTGERLSRATIQAYGKKKFELYEMHNLKQLGYTIEILHNPNQTIEPAAKSAVRPRKKE